MFLSNHLHVATQRPQCVYLRRRECYQHPASVTHGNFTRDNPAQPLRTIVGERLQCGDVIGVHGELHLAAALGVWESVTALPATSTPLACDFRHIMNVLSVNE